MWTTDALAEIPDDDPCAGFSLRPGGTNDTDVKKQVFLRFERGIEQDVLQTGFMLLSYFQ